MSERYKKPCIDSSVFIGGLNREICNGIKRGVIFDYILQKAREGRFSILVSAFTFAEVYKTKIIKTPTESVALDAFLDLMNEPFVEVIEVDREVGIKAHKLCRQFSANKLYPGDAIHLACALRAGCDYLLAWDGPLATITHPDIVIEGPVIYDRSLFAETELATAEEIETYEKQRRTLVLLPPPSLILPETPQTAQPIAVPPETKPEETTALVGADESESDREQ